MKRARPEAQPKDAKAQKDDPQRARTYRQRGTCDQKIRAFRRPHMIRILETLD
jgi:hypothetical protein